MYHTGHEQKKSGIFILTHSALTDQSPEPKVRLSYEDHRIIEYLEVEETHKDYKDLGHLRLIERAGVDLANGHI